MLNSSSFLTKPSKNSPASSGVRWISNMSIFDQNNLLKDRKTLVLTNGLYYNKDRTNCSLICIKMIQRNIGIGWGK